MNISTLSNWSFQIPPLAHHRISSPIFSTAPLFICKIYSYPLQIRSHRCKIFKMQTSLTETTPLLSSSSDPEHQPLPNQWKLTWNHILPFLIPETSFLRAAAFLSVLSILISKVLSLLIPYAFKLAIDAVTINSKVEIIIPYKALFLYIVSIIASSLFNSLERYCYSCVECNATRRMATALFSHILSLSPDFHQHRKTGELDKILDRGIESLTTISERVLFTLLPTVIETVIVAVIFFRLGTPFIAFSTFVAIICFLAFTIHMTSLTIRLRRQVNDVEDIQAEKIETCCFQYYDALINYETVRSFGMEREEVSRFSSLEFDIQEKYLRFQSILSSVSFGQNAIKGIGLGAAMIVAAHGVRNQLLTPGDFVLINSYVLQLFQPLTLLGSSFRIVTQAVTDLEKCVQIFDEKITVKDLPDARALHISTEDMRESRVGQISFKNVCFKYSKSDNKPPFILKDISFHVSPGKTLAIVGASGLGKSTILRLLMRMYDVDSGSVQIDGIDIRVFTQRSLRREIGIVSQDTLLFNETLRYNISYGSTNPTEVEVLEAARAASLSEFIQSLPEGLDTVVGELGVRLSGGEKQRVGCARAILRNPPIVLLDEASSALDTRTEKEMQNNLRQACSNRTMIIVAHRLSTITMADEIIVLGKNQNNEVSIEEQGTHSHLLEINGSYTRMWKVQVAQVNLCPKP